MAASERGKDLTLSGKAWKSVKTTLGIWLNVSTHIRFRDRSMKTVQYGCQMILGFYGPKLAEESIETLRLARYQASTARKAFWMLKSFNHVQVMVDMLDNLPAFSLDNKELGIFILAFIEQVYLVAYHYFESVVYLARTRIIDPKREDEIEDWTNHTWFVSDFFGFVVAACRLGIHVGEMRARYRELLLGDYRCSSSTSRSLSSFSASPQRSLRIPTDTGIFASAEWRAFQSLVGNKELMVALFDKLLTLTISTMETVAAADFYGLITKYRGAGLGDGVVGFLGAGSSILILTEGVLAQVRALESEDEEQEQGEDKEQEQGNDNDNDSGNGNDNANANDHGRGNANANGHGHGHGDDNANGHDNGHGDDNANGHDNGHGDDNGHDKGKKKKS